MAFSPQQLRKHRLRRGLTQAAAARLAQMDRSRWNRIEHGERIGNIELQVVERMARALNVSVDCLLEPPTRR